MAKKQKLTKENYPPAKTARRPKKFGSGYLPVMQQSEDEVKVIVPHAGEQRPGAPGGHGDWGPPDEPVNALPDLDFERQQLLDAGVPVENVDRIYPLEGAAPEGEEPVVTPEEAPLVPEEAAMAPVAEEGTSWLGDIANLYRRALVGGYSDISEGALEGLMLALNQAINLLPWGDQINRWGQELNELSGMAVSPDPQTPAGEVASDMVQISIGILPAIKLFKLFGVSNRFVSGMLGGGVGDFVTSDTEMARGVVSALKLIPSKDVEEFSNLINTWLDDNSGGRELEARLVNMGFGIPLGLAAEGFLKIFVKIASLAKQGGAETTKALRETVDATLGVEPRRPLIDPATDPAFREAGEKATADEVSAFLKVADEIALDAATEAVGRSVVSSRIKPRKGESVAQYIYRHASDRMAPLSRLTKLLADGANIPANLDPYKLARIGVASASKAQMALEYGVRNFDTGEIVSPSLKSILKNVRSSLGDFEKYAVARRAIELDGRGLKTGVDMIGARKMVSAYKGQEFDRAFNALVVYQDNLTLYLRDSGVISKELYKKMREANKDYVPFYRLMDDDAAKVGGGTSGAPIKALSKDGSERQIHNPMESIIKNTYFYMELAHRNEVGTALVNLSRQTELGMRLVKEVPPALKPISVAPKGAAAKEAVEEIVAKVPGTEDLLKKLGIKLTDEDMVIFRSANMPLGDNQIRIFRNGKAEIYEVDEFVAKIVQGHTQDSVNLAVKILRVPARTLRAGAILDPAFFVKNMIRDNVTAAIYSTSGYRPLVDYVSGFVSMIRKDKHWQDWVNSGGAQATLMSLDRDFLMTNLKQLTNTTGLLSRAKNVAFGTLEALRIASDFAENSTRVGEFKRAIDQLGDSTRRPSKAALTEAAFRSREITLDFARMGASVKALNQIIPFLNARIQGYDRMVRGFIDHPVQFNAKAVTSITMPSVYLWYANHDQPRYQEIPQWEKNIFWIFCADWDDPDAIIWRVPKPFELGIIYGTFAEHILDAAYEVEGFDIEELVSNMWGSIVTDSVAGFMPTGATPILEMTTNHDFFSDRPIVSSSQEKVLSQHQYGPNTSPTAIKVGQILAEEFGITGSTASPAHLQNNVANLTGTLGRRALQALDWALQSTGVLPEYGGEKPAIDWTREPFIDSFTIRNPSLNAQSVSEFYENEERLSKIYNSYKMLTESGRFAAAADLAESRGDDFTQVTLVREAISTLMKAYRKIAADATMPGEEKSVEIDKIVYQIIDLAQTGNKLAANAEKKIEQDREIFEQ
jgi:hypothetical protein